MKETGTYIQILQITAKFPHIANTAHLLLSDKQSPLQWPKTQTLCCLNTWRETKEQRKAIKLIQSKQHMTKLPENVQHKEETYRTHRMEDECCIFMLFFLFLILSEDWYTWILRRTQPLQVNCFFGLWIWLTLKGVCGCVFFYILHIQGQIFFAKWGHFDWSSLVQVLVWGLKPGFKVKVRTGFRSGVRVRGWRMYYLYESPDKDNSIEMCMCVSHTIRPLCPATQSSDRLLGQCWGGPPDWP